VGWESHIGILSDRIRDARGCIVTVNIAYEMQMIGRLLMASTFQHGMLLERRVAFQFRLLFNFKPPWQLDIYFAIGYFRKERSDFWLGCRVLLYVSY
jgi:hypothetical protein